METFLKLTYTRTMNDYKKISILEDGKERLITVKDTNEWHSQELSWLQSQIEEAKTAVTKKNYYS